MKRKATRAGDDSTMLDRSTLIALAKRGRVVCRSVSLFEFYGSWRVVEGLHRDPEDFDSLADAVDHWCEIVTTLPVVNP